MIPFEESIKSEYTKDLYITNLNRFMQFKNSNTIIAKVDSI